jgi:Protein of unknown function (DUF1552)
MNKRFKPYTTTDIVSIAHNKRRFLIGAGGSMLAIPFLPSLFTPQEAKAQSATQKCFAAFMTPHGGVGNKDMFPAESTLTQSQAYAGINIRRGDLKLSAAGNEVQLSNICRASSADLTPALAAKANLINGVDIPFWIDHNTGGAMGNWGDTNIGDRFAPTNFIQRTQTIDHYIGWSPSFYTDTSRVKERVVVLNDISYAYADPKNRTGAINKVSSTARGSRELFDKLFGTTTAPSRPLVVDQVVESYKQLRDGSARLSADDKKRLDEHMQRIYELQRKLQAAAPPAPPTRPAKSSSEVDVLSNFNTNASPQVEYFKLYNEVIVAAFSTGVCRVASLGTTGWEFGVGRYGTFADFAGDWHNDILHKYAYSGPDYDQLTAANRNFFSKVFLDLAKRMDAVNMGSGTTLLDQSLITWMQECGNRTHLGINLPIVAFGSAGGYLKTGQYLDYRNMNKMLGGSDPSYHGLVWQQWLATVLQSMGLPRSEYEVSSGAKGYPGWRTTDKEIIEWTRYNGYNGVTEPAYPDAVWNVAGDVLPWMKA